MSQQAATSQSDSRRSLFAPKVQDQIGLQARKALEWESTLRQPKDCSCPPEDGIRSDNDDSDDSISDIGEAAFAMLGSMWAEEGHIPTSLLFPNSINDSIQRIGDQDSLDKDLTKTRIGAILEQLSDHPFANELDIDAISEQVLN